MCFSRRFCTQAIEIISSLYNWHIMIQLIMISAQLSTYNGSDKFQHYLSYTNTIPIKESNKMTNFYNQFRKSKIHSRKLPITLPIELGVNVGFSILQKFISSQWNTTQQQQSSFISSNISKTKYIKQYNSNFVGGYISLETSQDE